MGGVSDVAVLPAGCLLLSACRAEIVDLVSVAVVLVEASLVAYGVEQLAKQTPFQIAPGDVEIGCAARVAGSSSLYDTGRPLHVLRQTLD